MARNFDKYEKIGAYHWVWYEYNEYGYRDRVDALVDHFPAEGSALDIGCGDGLISYRLFEQGLHVTGLDLSAEGVRLAREMCAQAIYRDYYANLTPRRALLRAGKYYVLPALRGALDRLGIYRSEKVKRFKAGALRFRAQSIYDLSAGDCFDYVICHEVIEHVPDPARLLDIIHSMVERFAIISTPNGVYHEPDDYDVQLWTPAAFETLLAGYHYEFITVMEDVIQVKLFKSP